ncbi:MAG: winged helix-turn-helix transcriptional regulator [Acidobacteria bacterium]|nr:winged helix-turn-helix transcriptional regulator [Acidobacteriota bacterium]
MATAIQRRAARSGEGVYYAIGDPTRRRLLDALGRGPRHVNDLARPFAMSRPAISQHLRILRDAGLVSMRRAGRERHYRLRAARLRQVYDWVAHYEKFWTRGLKALGDYLDRQTAQESVSKNPKVNERRKR